MLRLEALIHAELESDYQINRLRSHVCYQLSKLEAIELDNSGLGNE